MEEAGEVWQVLEQAKRDGVFLEDLREQLQERRGLVLEGAEVEDFCGDAEVLLLCLGRWLDAV